MKPGRNGADSPTAKWVTTQYFSIWSPASSTAPRIAYHIMYSFCTWILAMGLLYPIGDGFATADL